MDYAKRIKKNADKNDRPALSILKIAVKKHFKLLVVFY